MQIDDISKLNDIFSELKKEISSAIRNNRKFIAVPYDLIAKKDYKLAEELLDHPEDVIETLEKFVNEKFDLPYHLKVRVYGLPESRRIRIRDLRSEHIDKLIETEGIIKISSEVRPVVVAVKYKHDSPECGGEFWMQVNGFKIEKPKVCRICGKPGRFIEIERKTIDMQRLLLEETPEQIEKGESPAQMMVLLKEDLCEPKMERKTIPGTRVRVVGIVKTLKNTSTQAVLDLVLHAVYIEPVEKDVEEIELTPEDERKIKEFAASENAIEILSKNLVPSIYGKHYDPIKKALLLQLVGAPNKKRGTSKVRGNLHILLIGDPGTGKSQILMQIHKIAPKSRYVTGTSATSIGLTAMVRRDEFLKGGWALEAGALVLASGGIVCIDEMDKIPKDEITALHEAMEQQQITVNKANIHATLKAETAVLAAANPKYGRWDRMKLIADQIDLPPTIINRFDLIFVLKDIPDEDLDKNIAESILNSLTEEIEYEISPEFIKKYIIYAKKIKPEWTEKAKERIKDFYLTLRRQAQGEENPAIPISTRQLESLIRLAEAHARARLSKVVTEEDAEEAIKLLMHSMKMVGIDPETNRLDVDVLTVGISSSQRSRISIILEIIENLQKVYPDGIPIPEIVNEAKQYKISEQKVREVLDKLLANGTIFEPKQDHVKLLQG